jgi:hypothetical protein
MFGYIRQFCKHIAACLLIVTIFGFNLARADIRTQAIVTMFSNGKVMAIYNSIDRGRMEGTCYLFHVRKGVRDLEVRVCGSYSVEQLR